ncbi:MAG: hypothetical protein P9L97_05740 [Candidatus Tenebribacter davisii]|nr:hypothetical protein [Candidatus Tenebribacter davisii]
MTTPGKDTDMKFFKDYFIGKGTIEIFPINMEIPKKGVSIGHYHWRGKYPKNTFNVECNPEGICPICEMLKPKSKWKRFKLWLKKLVKK